ncbi:MAG: PaeR7I family type II restriction endonuclease, partial [Desulfohalobiaceae bacterium]|nr:PaeR7I family type II restriction endonuclease [Desulfohalobiaceae bacterium]
MVDFRNRVAKAVQHFWKIRASQQKNQGTASGMKDYGTRGAVTGGKHLDGFVSLLSELVAEAGLPDST